MYARKVKINLESERHKHGDKETKGISMDKTKKPPYRLNFYSADSWWLFRFLMIHDEGKCVRDPIRLSFEPGK